jgi:hypothetical protein
MAARAKVLKVGNITLAADGTKIMANASKHSAVSHGHAVEQMRLLEEEIAALLQRAADAYSAPLRHGLSIPAEPERSGDSQPQAARRASAARQIERRQDRLEKLKAAAAVMRERAKERHAQEQAEYSNKLQEHGEKQRQSGGKPRGKAPKPPQEGPRDSDQFDFTDAESRIMKAGSGQHFEQSYNAQAAVEVDSRLIIAGQVVDAPNDKQELQPTLGTLDPVIESVSQVLIDCFAPPQGAHPSAALQGCLAAGCLAPARLRLLQRSRRQSRGRQRQRSTGRSGGARRHRAPQARAAHRRSGDQSRASGAAGGSFVHRADAAAAANPGRTPSLRAAQKHH